MMDYLTLNCPFCAAKFKIKLAYAHLKGRCPVCGFRIKPPRPDLYEYKPLPTSTSDEPGGLLAEDEEWPEPAIIVAEEHHAGEYRLSDAPASPSPSRAEPEGSKEVFGLAPEYQGGPREEPLDAVPVEPPIKLAEPITPAKPAPPTKPTVGPVKAPWPNESGRTPPKPAKPAAPPSRPAVPLDPILDDVPLQPQAEPAKRQPPVAQPPVADAPGSPRAPEAPDAFSDDVLVPAPPRAEAKPAVTPAAEPKGPRFSAPGPVESNDDVPYADEAKTAAPSPPAAPVVGTYGFIDAPPGTKGVTAPVGEFDHVHASPQVAPLPEKPRGDKPPEAKWVPPPPGPSNEPPLEAKPATQAELYQYRLSQAEMEPYRPPPPPDSPLWTGVWNFAWQTSSLKMLVWFCLGFILVLLVLSWGITLAVSISHNEGAGAVAAGIGLVCVILGGIWIMLWTGSYTSACTFKIIDETANGEPAISGPDGGWKEWFIGFLRLGYLLAAGFVACGVFFLVNAAAGTVFLLILWPAVFNVFLLSNLAGVSSFSIFNGTIIGKLGGKLGVAFKMYVWTFVLLGVVITFLWLAIAVSAWCALPGGVLIAYCSLTYARMMGRVGMQLLADDSKPKKRRKKRRRKEGLPPAAGTEPEEPKEREAIA